MISSFSSCVLWLLKDLCLLFFPLFLLQGKINYLKIITTTLPHCSVSTMFMCFAFCILSLESFIWNAWALVFLMLICSFFNPSLVRSWWSCLRSHEQVQNNQMWGLTKAREEQMASKDKVHFHKNIPNNENWKKPNVETLKLNTSSKQRFFLIPQIKIRYEL